MNVSSVMFNSPVCGSVKPLAARLTVPPGPMGSLKIGSQTIPLVAKNGFANMAQICDGNHCQIQGVAGLQIAIQDVTFEGVTISNPELRLVSPTVFDSEADGDVISAGTMALELRADVLGNRTSIEIVPNGDVNVLSLSNSTDFVGNFNAIVSTGDFTVDTLSVTTAINAKTTQSWAAGVHYNVGNEVIFNGMVFRARQDHTSQVDWQPPATFALWERLVDDSTDWTPQVIYKTGDVVLFKEHSYRCIQGHQAQSVWTPPSVPVLWQKIT
ncbi:MAG TPA: carbohydrate-binding protein [Polyangia bacterium]